MVWSLDSPLSNSVISGVFNSLADCASRIDAAEERELNMCSSSVELGNSLVSMRVVLAKILQQK
jgi:hypothetical protein